MNIGSAKSSIYCNTVQVLTLIGTQVQYTVLHTLTVYIIGRIQKGENFTSVLALCCKAHFSSGFCSVFAFFADKMIFFFFL